MLDHPRLRLAPRMSRLRPSPTAEISQRLRRLAAEAREVINLGEGELDFDTPVHVRRAAHDAIERGETKYTSVAGTQVLREAIRDKLHNENGLDYTLDEIIAGPGAKPLILDALMATVSPGDEVIIPAPHWVSYPDMARLADGEPVILPCDAASDWKPTPERLAAALTPKSRWLVLNSPNNPTGAILTAEELSALARVLAPYPDVLVLCDDIYEHIRYDGLPFATMPEVEPALKSRCVVINGVSKAFSMTGWRLGYAAGPAPLIKAMETLQSQSSTNASSISQAAAVAALREERDFMDEWLTTLDERRHIVLEAIERAPGLACGRPQGAFYAYIDCSGLIGRKRPDSDVIKTDGDVAAWILDASGVGLIPGAAFGTSPYLRLAYAVDTDVLRRAMQGIVDACKQLG
ncbi:pyridoxal phosphate-dependent aminotransferase [Acuticoccus mangrovi]|uniref:Aminotransferase n=1 Tax=Acuticoccus mangrovi TaxID=2796142 RepID=A0A934IHI4_9HYPH|nr:pyridoxal phosphate-dependent aminotransferase [Acuticoccus mangrovi]MBJ3776568.1 pyridoxal phosphate-dependent aminotransferase [Acuticoccus mangrovi]